MSRAPKLERFKFRGESHVHLVPEDLYEIGYAKTVKVETVTEDGEIVKSRKPIGATTLCNRTASRLLDPGSRVGSFPSTRCQHCWSVASTLKLECVSLSERAKRKRKAKQNIAGASK